MWLGWPPRRTANEEVGGVDRRAVCFFSFLLLYNIKNRKKESMHSYINTMISDFREQRRIYNRRHLIQGIRIAYGSIYRKEEQNPKRFLNPLLLQLSTLDHEILELPRVFVKGFDFTYIFSFLSSCFNFIDLAMFMGKDLYPELPTPSVEFHHYPCITHGKLTTNLFFWSMEELCCWKEEYMKCKILPNRENNPRFLYLVNNLKPFYAINANNELDFQSPCEETHALLNKDLLFEGSPTEIGALLAFTLGFCTLQDVEHLSIFVNHEEMLKIAPIFRVCLKKVFLYGQFPHLPSSVAVNIIPILPENSKTYSYSHWKQMVSQSGRMHEVWTVVKSLEEVEKDVDLRKLVQSMWSVPPANQHYYHVFSMIDIMQCRNRLVLQGEMNNLSMMKHWEVWKWLKRVIYGSPSEEETENACFQREERKKMVKKAVMNVCLRKIKKTDQPEVDEVTAKALLVGKKVMDGNYLEQTSQIVLPELTTLSSDLVQKATDIGNYVLEILYENYNPGFVSFSPRQPSKVTLESYRSRVIDMLEKAKRSFKLRLSDSAMVNSLLLSMKLILQEYNLSPSSIESLMHPHSDGMLFLENGKMIHLKEDLAKEWISFCSADWELFLTKITCFLEQEEDVKEEVLLQTLKSSIMQTGKTIVGEDVVHRIQAILLSDEVYFIDRTHLPTEEELRELVAQLADYLINWFFHVHLPRVFEEMESFIDREDSIWMKYKESFTKEDESIESVLLESYCLQNKPQLFLRGRREIKLTSCCLQYIQVEKQTDNRCPVCKYARMHGKKALVRVETPRVTNKLRYWFTTFNLSKAKKFTNGLTSLSVEDLLQVENRKRKVVEID